MFMLGVLGCVNTPLLAVTRDNGSATVMSSAAVLGCVNSPSLVVTEDNGPATVMSVSGAVDTWCGDTGVGFVDTG